MSWIASAISTACSPVMPLLTLRLSTSCPEPVQRLDGFNNDSGMTVASDCRPKSAYTVLQSWAVLYGCESWTTYQRHVRCLNQFHLRCLRQILGIKWQDRIPNTEVLKRCQLEEIDAHIIRAQLRWSGHVVLMDDSRLRKALLYGQLKSAQRPMKQFKDVLKSNLRRWNIDRTTWETAAQARSSWRRTCFAGVSEFENNRSVAGQEKRDHHKENPFINNAATNTAHVCHICGRQCAAAIGLVSHLPSHKRRASSVDLKFLALFFPGTCCWLCLVMFEILGIRFV